MKEKLTYFKNKKTGKISGFANPNQKQNQSDKDLKDKESDYIKPTKKELEEFFIKEKEKEEIFKNKKLLRIERKKILDKKIIGEEITEEEIANYKDLLNKTGDI